MTAPPFGALTLAGVLYRLCGLDLSQDEVGAPAAELQRRMEDPQAGGLASADPLAIIAAVLRDWSDERGRRAMSGVAMAIVSVHSDARAKGGKKSGAIRAPEAAKRDAAVRLAVDTLPPKLREHLYAGATMTALKQALLPRTYSEAAIKRSLASIRSKLKAE